MADKIDKSLTQGPRGSVNIPGQEEIQEAVEQEVLKLKNKKGPVEVKKKKMDQLQLTFDPNAASPEGGDEHYANLAEFLPDEVLDELGSDLTKVYGLQRMSRKDWEQSYTKGLDLIRF